MRTITSLAVLAVTLAACPKKTPDKPDSKPVIDAGTEPGSNAPVVDASAPKVDPLCANRPEKAGPFVLDATLAAQRRGANAKTYVDADSSKERPIEVCGLEGARLWLEKTKCPDGGTSQNEGRVGSAGLGGRCNTMIERYKVLCKEGPINVYFGVHFCGPGEAM